MWGLHGGKGKSGVSCRACWRRETAKWHENIKEKNETTVTNHPENVMSEGVEL